MLSIGEIFGILFIHWLADFVFQTDEQAINKSKSNKALFDHVFTYCLIWFVAIGIAKTIYIATTFVAITFIIHYITDYVTSRLNADLYSKGERHNFFVSIGFDQILHYVQLILTYHYLTK